MSVEEILQTLQRIDPSTIFTYLDTQFSRHSTYNYAAVDSEIPSIRVIVSQRKEQISTINTVIERMETLLDQFRKKREQIVSSMKMHEGLVSCIRRLPSDVLKDIFVRCLPQSMHVMPNVDSAPLLLTRICRDWREIALDTGRLWSSLYVIKPGQSQEKFFFHRHNWLERAKRCQLSLRIHLNSMWEPSNSCQGWKDAVLKFLQAYTSRLTRLSIDFDESEADRLDQFLGDVPVLESLFLTGIFLPGTQEHKISIIQLFPRLRTLSINTMAFDIGTLSSVNLGWTNLTRLAMIIHHTIVEDPHPVFVTLLTMCPNLEYFAFSPVCILRIARSASITHAKLRILEIATDGGVYGSILVSNTPTGLMLPNLRHLQICNCAGDISFQDIEQVLVDEPRYDTFTVDCWVHLSEDILPALFTSFNPGWTDLRRVTVKLCCQAREVFRLLQLCPNLEDVFFCWIDTTDVQCASDYAPLTHPTLRSLGLIIKSGPPGILLQMLTFPRLSELLIDLNPSLPSNPHWPHSEFKEFLSRSRCPLQRLTIQGVRPTDEEYEELTTLIRTGPEVLNAAETNKETSSLTGR